jgi:hypothetical protein
MATDVIGNCHRQSCGVRVNAPLRSVVFYSIFW